MKGTALGTRNTSLTPVLVTKRLQPEGGHSQGGHMARALPLVSAASVPRTGMAGHCVPQTRPCLCTELKSGVTWCSWASRDGILRSRVTSHHRDGQREWSRGRTLSPTPGLHFLTPPDLCPQSSVFWALYDLPPAL